MLRCFIFLHARYIALPFCNRLLCSCNTTSGNQHFNQKVMNVVAEDGNPSLPNMCVPH